MGIASSLYAGVGGLQAYGQAMNVIGDNIANVNTVGFKSSRTVFGDILASSGGGLQIGRGSQVRDVNLSFEIGSLESTGNSTDVAIQGNGFFILGDISQRYYTRAGQFTLDDSGYLVGGTGIRVQGFGLDATTGLATGNLTDINLANVQSQPRSTSTFTLGANLDAAASATTTFQSAVNMFNSIGELVTLTVTFTKGATAGAWTYASTASVGSATSGTLTVGGATGALQFDSTGSLSTPTTDPTFTISGCPSGASTITTSWDLMTGTGVTNGDLTSYASNSVTNSITQNGFGTGTLRGLSISEEGIISGLFSNGQSQNLSQLGLADFLSPWGLSKQGNSLYSETADSGQAIFGTANSGRFGSIAGNSLELSNVDLGTEFVKLIQTQRAFQANSRIITSVDEMLVEVVNLKR